MQDRLCRLRAGVFQALAHPTRIAVVELLRDEGKTPVGTICERLGLEQANASQHLAVLRSKQIVSWRKVGNKVLYSLRDRMIVRILDMMQRYFQDHLNQDLKLLGAISEEKLGKRKSTKER
jgi:ArsR family transcriptional regulator